MENLYKLKTQLESKITQLNNILKLNESSHDGWHLAQLRAEMNAYEEVLKMIDEINNENLEKDTETHLKEQ